MLSEKGILQQRQTEKSAESIGIWLLPTSGHKQTCVTLHATHTHARPSLTQSLTLSHTQSERVPWSQPVSSRQDVHGTQTAIIVAWKQVEWEGSVRRGWRSSASPHLADSRHQPSYLLTCLFSLRSHRRLSGGGRERKGKKSRREIVLKVSGRSQKIHCAEKFLPTQVLSQEFLCQPADMSGILSCRFSNKYFWHTFLKCKPQVCSFK